jgi:hypothetical protein
VFKFKNFTQLEREKREKGGLKLLYQLMLGGFPVTKVLGLQIEEWPQLWIVTANMLNKQPWTNDMGWYSSFGVRC